MALSSCLPPATQAVARAPWQATGAAPPGAPAPAPAARPPSPARPFSPARSTSREAARFPEAARRPERMTSSRSWASVTAPQGLAALDTARRATPRHMPGACRVMAGCMAGAAAQVPSRSSWTPSDSRAPPPAHLVHRRLTVAVPSVVRGEAAPLLQGRGEAAPVVQGRGEAALPTQGRGEAALPPKARSEAAPPPQVQRFHSAALHGTGTVASSASNQALRSPRVVYRI